MAQSCNFAYDGIIHIVPGDRMASSLCLDSTILDAKSDSLDLFTGEGILKNLQRKSQQC